MALLGTTVARRTMQHSAASVLSEQGGQRTPCAAKALASCNGWFGGFFIERHVVH